MCLREFLISKDGQRFIKLEKYCIYKLCNNFRILFLNVKLSSIANNVIEQLWKYVEISVCKGHCLQTGTVTKISAWAQKHLLYCKRVYITLFLHYSDHFVYSTCIALSIYCYANRAQNTLTFHLHKVHFQLFNLKFQIFNLNITLLNVSLLHSQGAVQDTPLLWLCIRQIKNLEHLHRLWYLHDIHKCRLTRHAAVFSRAKLI